LTAASAALVRALILNPSSSDPGHDGDGVPVGVRHVGGNEVDPNVSIAAVLRGGRGEVKAVFYCQPRRLTLSADGLRD
jgi:hypothetical protein